MTIRADMAAACGPDTHNFETRCGGRVRLTQEHINEARAVGNLDEVLAEARLGCAQKCGCLNSDAWFYGAPDGMYVVAQCAMDPGERELGHRDAPEPDGRSR